MVGSTILFLNFLCRDAGRSDGADSGDSGGLLPGNWTQWTLIKRVVIMFPERSG
jgi:hypothetical protein